MGLKRKYSYYNKKNSILFFIASLLFLLVNFFIIIVIMPSHIKNRSYTKIFELSLILLVTLSLNTGLFLIVFYSIPRYIVIERDIKLPFKYKYNYPRRVIINCVPINTVSVVSNDNIELESFLKNNKSSIKPHMISYHDIKNNPDMYTSLKFYYDDDIFFIVLINRFFDDIDTFLIDIKDIRVNVD